MRFVVTGEELRNGAGMLVEDTHCPMMIGGQPWERNGKTLYEVVAECTTREDAELVCAALNAYCATKDKMI